MGDSAILILTFPRYAPLARLTARAIEENWTDHPPIRFFGDPEKAEVRNVSWMDGALEASMGLRKEGFQKVYLILDDLMPVGRCHDEHLNRTLPRWMDELDATYIGLLGWGQGQGNSGKLLEGYLDLERVAEDFRYKFSLHPGLWNLERLIEVLERMVQRFPESERSPWFFEKYSGSDSTVPLLYRKGAYRINGLEMSFSPAWAEWNGFFRRRAKGLKGLLPRMSQAFLHYYEGPYPMVWSGMMHKGKLHDSFSDHLRQRFAFSLLSDVKSAVEEVRKS